MKPSPYSIYIDQRPIRIAFLVSPDSKPELLDIIFKYNLDIWGGRFNPIILTDGKTIGDKWWQFLASADPDIIKSLVPLEDQLLKKIYDFLSPYSVEVPRTTEGQEAVYPDIHDDPISILPTPENVKLVARSFGGETNLVLFDLDEVENEIMRLFTDRNFGTYEQYKIGESKSYCMPIDREVKKQGNRPFPITTLGTLNEALLELSSYYKHFVYPRQMSCLPNTFKDVQYDRENEAFTLIIGDSLQDIVYFWNRTLMIPSWMRTDITHLWLPLQLVSEPELDHGLKKWLRKYAHSTGNQNNRAINFVSFSLSEEELRKIADNFVKETYLPSRAIHLTEPQIPNYGPKFHFVYVSEENKQFHRANSNEEHIILNEPDVKEGIMGGEYWMADMFIEFRPERYQNLIGRKFWWKLPPKNELAFDMLKRPARICLDGFPAALMRRGEPMLSIRLPEDDDDIIHALLVGDNRPIYSSDPRGKFAKRPFYEVRRSDKGRYLDGFISLFPGLSSAHLTLKERYWRRMFNILSHQDPSADEERIKEIENKLKGEPFLHGFDSRGNPEDLKRLAKYILQKSKEQAIISKELPFRKFVEEAQKEYRDFNKPRSRGEKFKFEGKDLKESMSELISSNILLAGISPRCPFCGSINWYSAEEIKQKLQCRGCRYEFPLTIEAKWYYKLNTLAQKGCAYHGLIPVILVLGQLSDNTESSFISTTSLDVFKKREEGPFTDLDIVCVKDGEFIIGEVKQSVDGFKQEDFKKMEEVAKLLKPNVLLFSSLDERPGESMKRNIASLKEKLSPLGVKVTWYQLDPWTFEPSTF